MGYRSQFAADSFNGRNIVVTGAGSGIGRCTAHELASLGAHVVLIGRKRERLEAVAAEIASDGGEASIEALDIRDEDAVKRAVSSVMAARGAVDGLVNNAGGQFPAPLAAISKKGFEAVVSTNLTGGFLVARELFVQGMNRPIGGGGAIVNMLADYWGGMPGMGHSGAARAGMMSFTETAAVEWSACGVRVNAVAPGWVASSGLDKYDDATVRALIPEMKRQVPLQRLASEAEVSAAIVFLLSDAAAFITGAVIKIDGGASLNTKNFPMAPHDRSQPFEGFHRAITPAILGAATSANSANSDSKQGA